MWCMLDVIFKVVIDRKYDISSNKTVYTNVLCDVQVNSCCLTIPSSDSLSSVIYASDALAKLFTLHQSEQLLTFDNTAEINIAIHDMNKHL